MRYVATQRDALYHYDIMNHDVVIISFSIIVMLLLASRADPSLSSLPATAVQES